MDSAEHATAAVPFATSGAAHPSRRPMSNEELLKRVLESREKFKRTVAATISRKNLVSEDELSDDTKELIAETKKDLNEIERVVGEFQTKQKEMQRFVGKAEAEVERLESKELEIIRNLKAQTMSQQKKGYSSGGSFSLVFWLFSLIVVAFLAVLIHWEYVSDRWEYTIEYVFDVFRVPRTPVNAPY